MECVVGAHCQLQPTNIVDVECVGSKTTLLDVVYIYIHYILNHSSKLI